MLSQLLQDEERMRTATDVAPAALVDPSCQVSARVYAVDAAAGIATTGLDSTIATWSAINHKSMIPAFHTRRPLCPT